MSFTLSPRLACCAQLIPPGSTVADVGADHGYLGIWLLLHQRCRHVIAADLRQKPLETARRNAGLYGTAGQMEFILSDGLAHIAPGSFDTLVCAGMGGDCITHILTSAPWLKAPQYTLVLQPQTSGNDLRRYLGQAGFAITQERLVQDGRFLYFALAARYGGGQRLSPGQQYVSPALLSGKDPLLSVYLRRLRHSLTATVNGISRSTDPADVPRHAYYAQALEEIIIMEEETQCKQ